MRVQSAWALEKLHRTVFVSEVLTRTPHNGNHVCNDGKTAASNKQLDNHL